MNVNFFVLGLFAPNWLKDDIAVSISKSLTKRGWIIDRKISESNNEVVFSLVRADGKRTSSKWILRIKYYPLLFGGTVDWKITTQ